MNMQTSEVPALSNRRELLFLYDIKMGNPNGDPDENRPRVLPDGTYYVTDVRLKRFVRDYFKQKGLDILVDNIEGKTTNLTGRIVHYLQAHGLKLADGQDLVKILLDAFIDARLFGSSLAFKAEPVKDSAGKAQNYAPKPEPKTLTGAVQFNMGEVLHQAEAVDIHGSSVFASDSGNTQGTFTSFYGLRYALIAFSGVANQYSAALSSMTPFDYDRLMLGLWNGVRSAANTRSKVGQVPQLLVSVEYHPGEEFQFGRLHDYVKTESRNGKPALEWASPDDYVVNLQLLCERLGGQASKISTIRYSLSPDLHLAEPVPSDWQPFDANAWM